MEKVESHKELAQGQVGLLQVDPNTGVPVADTGDWLKSGEERYLKFDNEVKAREYTSSRLRENPLLEWSLVDSNGNQIATIHDQQALAEAARSAKKSQQGLFAKWFKR